MGGVVRRVKKTARKVVKEVGDLPKDIVKVADKAIVEPLERPVKKAINFVEKVGADIVEPLERPVKKLTKEIVETVTGTDKMDYRQPQQPVITPEVTPEIVPDEEETILARGRGTRRTKRPGQGGTIIEGYGALQRGKGERSVV
tara:strand:- start:53 stop:484 length:432 start_codon:yes stop_codon:yes gene_type:complete